MIIKKNRVWLKDNIVYIDVSTKTHKNKIAMIDAKNFDKIIDGLGRWIYMKSSKNRYVVGRQIGTKSTYRYTETIKKTIMGDTDVGISHIDGDPLNCLENNLFASVRTGIPLNKDAAEAAKNDRKILVNREKHIKEVVKENRMFKFKHEDQPKEYWQPYYEVLQKNWPDVKISQEEIK